MGLALEEERLRNPKNVEKCAIVFMNLTMMVHTAKKFWELTSGEILTQTKVSLWNDDGDGGGHVDGDGGRVDGGGDGVGGEDLF